MPQLASIRSVTWLLARDVHEVLPVRARCASAGPSSVIPGGVGPAIPQALTSDSSSDTGHVLHVRLGRVGFGESTHRQGHPGVRRYDPQVSVAPLHHRIERALVRERNVPKSGPPPPERTEHLIRSTAYKRVPQNSREKRPLPTALLALKSRGTLLLAHFQLENKQLF